MTIAIQCIINSYLAFCIFHFFSMTTLLQLGVSSTLKLKFVSFVPLCLCAALPGEQKTVYAWNRSSQQAQNFHIVKKTTSEANSISNLSRLVNSHNNRSMNCRRVLSVLSVWFTGQMTSSTGNTSIFVTLWSPLTACKLVSCLYVIKTEGKRPVTYTFHKIISLASSS